MVLHSKTLAKWSDYASGLVPCLLFPCTGVTTYDPYSFNKEITRLDELNKMLTEVQQRLTKVNSESAVASYQVESLGRESLEILCLIYVACTRQ